MPSPERREIYPPMPASWMAASVILTVCGDRRFPLRHIGRDGAQGMAGLRGELRVLGGPCLRRRPFFGGPQPLEGCLGQAPQTPGRVLRGLPPCLLPPLLGLMAREGVHIPVGPESLAPEGGLSQRPLHVRPGRYLAFSALTVLSLLLVYYSVKADREWLALGGPPLATHYPWTGLFRSQWRFSPVLPAAYAFILSLVAIDLIMSLDPEWYSTLFPGYYFIASFYSAIVALYLFALVARNRLALAPLPSPPAVPRPGQADIRLLHLHRVSSIRAAPRDMVRQFAGGNAIRDPPGKARAVEALQLGGALPYALHPLLHAPQQEDQDSAGPHDLHHHHDPRGRLDGALPPCGAVHLDGPAGHSLRDARGPDFRGFLRPGVALHHGFSLARSHRARFGPAVPQVSLGGEERLEPLKAR